MELHYWKKKKKITFTVSEALEIREGCEKKCRNFCAAWALIKPENQSTKFEYGKNLSSDYSQLGIFDFRTGSCTREALRKNPSLRLKKIAQEESKHIPSERHKWA